MINFKRIAESISRGDASIDELQEVIIEQRSFNPDEVDDVTETLSNLSSLGLLEPQAKNALLAVVAAKAVPAPAEKLQVEKDRTEKNQQGEDQQGEAQQEEDQEERTVFAAGFDPEASPAAQETAPDDDATRIVDASLSNATPTPPPDQSDAPASARVSKRPEIRSRPSGGNSFSASSGSSWSDLAGKEGATDQLEVGSVLKGRFVLEELIGVGGMGLVFKARDLLKEEAEERNPYIAIKILNDDFKRHPLSLKALQREARKSQTLAHPNIVNVFDFDRDGDNVFMTMEYLVGSPLDKAIKERTGHPFPLEEALNYIRQMAEALRYAHRLGVVHSDFKPSNVFLTADGTLKVFDFGIARANKQGDRAVEMTVFDAGTLGALTPAYASLEMLEGIDPEPSDDIYALGCVAYELLTTKHPYQKQRATLALAREMKPKRIEGLGRRQWTAIEKSLALRRQERTESVDEFLKQLDGSGGNSPLVYGVAAAALALGVGLLYVPDYLERQQLEELRSSLSSGDSSQIRTALATAESIDPALRAQLFLSVRDQLTQHYVEQANAAVDESQQRYAFPVAESLLEEALSQYPDSKRLADAAALITERKYTLLNELDSSFTEALEELQTAAGTQGEQLEQVLQRVAEVDPTSSLLTDRRVPQAYNSASVAALAQGDLVAARQLAETGLERFPEDLGLIDQLDLVTQKETAIANARRIADLESDLLAGIESPLSLDELRALVKPLEELVALNPESPVIAQARAKTLPLLREAVADRTASYDWAAAGSLLENYDAMLDASAVEALRGEIEALRSERRARLEETMAQIRRAARADELTGGGTSALAGLEALTDMQADSALIAQARSVVLDAYLNRARSFRAEQDWNAAEQAVADGLLIAQDGSARSRLERENREIARSRAESVRSIAAAKQERVAAEREQQKAEIVAQIETLLATPDVSATEVQQLLSATDDLVALDPANEIAAESRNRMVARVLERARDLRSAGELTAAQDTLERVSLLIPGSQALRDEIDTLKRTRTQVADRALEQRQLQASQTLAGLLNNPRLDERWEASVREELRRLEELGALDQSRKREVNERVADVFLTAANESLANSRFAETRALIDRGRQYAADLPGWETVSTALAAAQTQYAEQRTAAAKTAKIAGLQRTLRTQAKAKAVTSARQTLQQLAELTPGDPFVAEEAPQLLGAAYASLAESAAQRDEFTKALVLAEAGLEIAPDYEPLQAQRRAMLIISHAAEVERILREVQIDDAARATDLLAQLRRLDPEGYGPRADSMVATAVDSLQRLADTDPERAEAGLAVAQELFAGRRELSQLNFDAQRQRLAEQQRRQASRQYAERAVAEIEKAPLTIDRLSFAVEQVQKAKQTDPENKDLPGIEAMITDSYLSLAAAQQENEQLEDALSTIEEGLAFEDGNRQLLRLQRQIAKEADKGKRRRRSFSSF